MLKFLKVFENIMKKIKIHSLQKALILLNVKILKLGFKKMEGWIGFENLRNLKRKLCPKNTERTPEGRYEGPARTPQGPHKDPARTPQGPHKDATADWNLLCHVIFS